LQLRLIAKWYWCFIIFTAYFFYWTKLYKVLVAENSLCGIIMKCSMEYQKSKHRIPNSNREFLNLSNFWPQFSKDYSRSAIAKTQNANCKKITINEQRRLDKYRKVTYVSFRGAVSILAKRKLEISIAFRTSFWWQYFDNDKTLVVLKKQTWAEVELERYFAS